MRYILGIESSCDETAASVVENGTIVRSSIIASQIDSHRQYGGVVPEIASRKHLDNVSEVVAAAMTEADISFEELDGIAVTNGPGLIGALLVGVCYAKAAAFSLGTPLIGVHHIEGHIFSSVFEYPAIEYPALALIVSGGHTDIFLIRTPHEYERLGHTRDDAAGEAFDKIARLLGLGYPGGPVVDRLALTGEAKNAKLVYRPPQIPDAPYDFSFSGLKTATQRFIRENDVTPVADLENVPENIRDVCASFQRAVVQTLIGTLERAIETYQPMMVLTGGGVVCNSALRTALREVGDRMGVEVRIPSPKYTTDNAAMIAAAGYSRLMRGERADWRLSANPVMKLHTTETPHSSRFRN
jgi:N6-L-threonylcarbamoyladenine synthase